MFHPLSSSMPNSPCLTILSMGATIAERLKSEIDARTDVKAVDVAKAIGVSKAAMSAILSGSTKQPKPENLLGIADYLGLEMRWVISGKGPRTTQEARMNALDISGLGDPDKAKLQAIVVAFEESQVLSESNNH